MEAAVERVSEFLSADELRDLTGSKPRAKQVAWLAAHGIPHRADGERVIVSRVHARGWLEGRTVVVSSGPNWGAIK